MTPGLSDDLSDSVIVRRRRLSGDERFSTSLKRIWKPGKDTPDDTDIAHATCCLVRLNQRNPRLEFPHGQRNTDRARDWREQRDRL